MCNLLIAVFRGKFADQAVDLGEKEKLEIPGGWGWGWGVFKDPLEWKFRGGGGGFKDPLEWKFQGGGGVFKDPLEWKFLGGGGGGFQRPSGMEIPGV